MCGTRSFVGSVELSDGRVNLRAVGQTLEDVTGRAIFDEDGVAITDLRATDTNGSAEVDGRVGFKKLRLKKRTSWSRRTSFLYARGVDHGAARREAPG